MKYLRAEDNNPLDLDDLGHDAPSPHRRAKIFLKGLIRYPCRRACLLTDGAALLPLRLSGAYSVLRKIGAPALLSRFGKKFAVSYIVLMSTLRDLPPGPGISAST